MTGAAVVREAEAKTGLEMAEAAMAEVAMAAAEMAAAEMAPMPTSECQSRVVSVYNKDSLVV